MALMALGVSTFMGTSAALATDVNVSGSVGPCRVPSTVNATDLSLGSIEPGDYGSANITPGIIQGTTSNCKPRVSSVTASLGSFSDNVSAAPDGNKVVMEVMKVPDGSFQIDVYVPFTATVGQAFSAILTFTLIG
jgi:hypothetical protein